MRVEIDAKVVTKEKEIWEKQKQQEHKLEYLLRWGLQNDMN